MNKIKRLSEWVNWGDFTFDIYIYIYILPCRYAYEWEKERVIYIYGKDRNNERWRGNNFKACKLGNSLGIYIFVEKKKAVKLNVYTECL